MTEQNTQGSIEEEGPLHLIKQTRQALKKKPDMGLPQFFKNYLQPILESVVDEYSIGLDDLDSQIEGFSSDNYEALQALEGAFHQSVNLNAHMSAALDLLMQHQGALTSEGLVEEKWNELPEDFRNLYQSIKQEMDAFQKVLVSVKALLEDGESLSDPGPETSDTPDEEDSEGEDNG